MNYPTLIAIAAGSYLLGSIPFGYLLVRVFQGVDVRSIGSGNIGATNVARTGGKWLAIATLVLDALKGWLPVFLVLTIHGIPTSGPAQLHTMATLAALCAVIGHMFPLWLGFRGGKGVATGLGVFLALAPNAVLVALALFVALWSSPATFRSARFLLPRHFRRRCGGLTGIRFPLLHWRCAQP